MGFVNKQSLGQGAADFTSRYKQLFIIFCKYGLGLGLLAWQIWKNWDGITEALRRPMQVTPLVLGFTIYLIAMLLTFVRWYVLVRAQDLPFTLFNAVRLGLLGVATSMMLPGSITGDAFKATFIAREQSRRTVAVATVMIDRVVGLLGLIWLVVLLGTFFWLTGDPAIHAHRGLQVMVVVLAAVVGTSLLAWVLAGVLSQEWADRLAVSVERAPRIGHSLAELWRALWMYRVQGPSVVLALVLAIVGHVGFVLTFFFASQAFLGPDQVAQVPSLGENFLLVPIGMTCEAGIPTPGGVGGGEYIFGKLYALIGKSEELGVLASLVRRLIVLAIGVAGYLVYLSMKPAASSSNGGSSVASLAA